MDIQRQAFEESNNVNPDWSFKFDEELQQYVATDFEMTNQVDEFNEHWDTFRAGWDAKAQSVLGWISVKDQLPPSDPYNREYWVYETLNNRVQHDYWVCPDTGLDQDFEPFFNNWPREVTHWMPMAKYPKPPVQVQEPTND